MTQTSSQALFIVFEGVDGAGTTTQSDLLVARLRAAGCDCIQTREPGGTEFGEGVRSLVLDPHYEDVDPVAELFMYGAARRQHAHELIEPALRSGKPVICDRYAASTAAYQGGGRGLDRDLVRRVNAAAVGRCVPSLTILLDLPVAIGEERREARREAADRLELAGRAFQERVRAEYLTLAEAQAADWWVVSATPAADELGEAIYRELSRRWPRFPYGPANEPPRPSK